MWIPERGRVGVRVVLVGLVALGLVSCRSSDEGATRDEAREATPDGMPDGINDAYLDPDLNVDEWVLRFEVESREIYASRRGLVDAVRLQPGMEVADIGAGTGLFMEPFARAVGPSGRVYAVDIAPRFIEHLSSRAATLGLTQVEARLCSEDDVDLPAASVDVAWVCDTYHHFESPMSTLASLYDAIRPGGTLVVVDFIREPGVSREWVLNHVRAGKATFRKEIEDAGFVFLEEVDVEGVEENYVLRFRRPR